MAREEKMGIVNDHSTLEPWPFYRCDWCLELLYLEERDKHVCEALNKHLEAKEREADIKYFAGGISK